MLGPDGATVIESDDNGGTLGAAVLEHRRGHDPRHRHVLPRGRRPPARLPARCRTTSCSTSSPATRPRRPSRTARPADPRRRALRVRHQGRPTTRTFRARAGRRRHRVPVARPRPRARRHAVQRAARVRPTRPARSQRVRHRRRHPVGGVRRHRRQHGPPSRVGRRHGRRPERDLRALDHRDPRRAAQLPHLHDQPGGGGDPGPGHGDLPDRRGRRRARSTTWRSGSTSRTPSCATSTRRSRRRGNRTGLFDDIGRRPGRRSAHADARRCSTTTPARRRVYEPLKGRGLQPEPAGSLGLLAGQQAAGTWNLFLRDDARRATSGPSCART